MKPGQPAKSTTKPNIHWWNQKGVLYYELLKPGENINGERYRTQLIRLKRAIAEKRPEYVTRHEAIIFHRDNARTHVAIPVKNYLENSAWEVLPHLSYSPDLAPSDYHLFRSMQNVLTEIRFTSEQGIKNLLHSSWPQSRRSSFGMEFTNSQKDGKKSLLQMGNTLNNTTCIVHVFLK